jgi:hypothetical protein
MKYAAASDTVICKNHNNNGKREERGGRQSLTAIHRNIRASMENVNDAASQPDMCKTRK